MKFYRLFLLHILFLFSLATVEAKEKVCLNMIVKDESQVIERCLSSLKPYIDYWVIVDTGSMDGTQDMIKNYLKDIPGELHERPWRNFGDNRTEALELAQNKGDFILFMDADDWLEFDEDFELPALTSDYYFMKRGTKTHTYYKPQLVKSGLPLKWVGVTHEYLSCDRPVTSKSLHKMMYVSGDDGSSHADRKKKFLKNIELLKEGLIQEPHNTRYAFYLAESYKDAGMKEEALAAYERHTQTAGWDQEIFWSYMQMGCLRRDLGFPVDEVINSFYKAHRYRPHRVEPIYSLAEIYNQQGKHDLAYALLKSRTFIPKPPEKDLVLSADWVEEFGLAFQLSLCSYYLGHYQESLEASDAVLTYPHLPENFRQHAKTNRNLALTKLQEKTPLQALAVVVQDHHKIAESGTPVEIFSSLLEIAKLEELAGLPSHVVIDGYQRAMDHTSSQIEPYYYLTSYYRKLGKFKEAYEVALSGFNLLPSSTSLPSHHWIQDWGMFSEYSLASWSVGKFQEAIDATLPLVDHPSLSEESRQLYRRNLTYYRPGIEILEFAQKNWGPLPWEKKTSENQENTASITFTPPSQRPHLHVCTEASHHTPQLSQLEKSCEAHQIKLDVVGLGEKFSFGKKLRDYHAYLKDIPDDDVVLFIDAYDTLVLASEQAIIDQFLSMNAPIVVSVETACHPFIHLSEYYPPSPSPYKYLNSGSYIGYAKTLKQVFEKISPIPDETDDQGILTVYYLYHPEEFKLDYQCSLFLSLFQTDPKHLAVGKAQSNLQYLPTQSYPCVVHGNSSGKALYQDVYNRIFGEK